MVGLVPTIQPSANAGAMGEMDPRDKPEDDTRSTIVRTIRMIPMTTHVTAAAAATHAAHITDQFTRQAAGFARSPALHNQAALDLLVGAAEPKATDASLDVACGPGSVALAFARR